MTTREEQSGKNGWVYTCLISRNKGLTGEEMAEEGEMCTNRILMDFMMCVCHENEQRETRKIKMD